MPNETSVILFTFYFQNMPVKRKKLLSNLLVTKFFDNVNFQMLYLNMTCFGTSRNGEKKE